MSNPNLNVNYLGLQLKSPLIAAASDFTTNIDHIIQLEQTGCGAVVLKSLFEEQILMDIDSQRTNNMFDSYIQSENYIAFYTRKHAIDNYIDLIRKAKSAVKMPVIASVHCSTPGKWVEFSRIIEQSGADALELNIFILPSNPGQNCSDIEQIYYTIIDEVKKNTKLPVAVKLHYYFTDMARFMSSMAQKADALVLFNRFYNPDINIEHLSVGSSGILSSESDNYIVQRWMAILSPLVKAHLAASGGIHTWQAIARNILAGATVVQLASVLYMKGPQVISDFTNNLGVWMHEKNFSDLSSFRGKLNYASVKNPGLYERAQFMKYFSDAGK